MAPRHARPFAARGAFLSAALSEADLGTHETVVTRVLGVLDDAAPYTSIVPAADVRAILLCTDGAWRPFAGSTDPPLPDRPGGEVIQYIEAAWRGDGTRDDATAILVELAESGG